MPLPKWNYAIALIVIGVWLLFDLAAYLVTEGLWFHKLGYFQVFWLQLLVRSGLALLVTVASISFLLANLHRATKLKYPPPTELYDRPKILCEAASAPIGMRSLLLSVAGCYLLLCIIVLHVSQVAVEYWQPVVENGYTIAPSIPEHLTPKLIWQILQALPFDRFRLVGAIALVAALCCRTRLGLQVLSILFSISFGYIFYCHWDKLLLFFQHTPFGTTDPVFAKDVGFYIFQVPFWRLLEFWLSGLIAFGAIAVLLTYLLSGHSLSRGNFPGFSIPQQRHLLFLGGITFLEVALRNWLERYELLNAAEGIIYGASYTPAQVELPARTLLCVIALLLAAVLFWQAAFRKDRKEQRSGKLPTSKTIKLLPILPVKFYVAGYIGLTFVSTFLLPILVQRIVVQPNELVWERPYIKRSIAFTRKGFNLDEVDAQTFDPEGQLTYETLRENYATIRNIRLWDSRPLLATNRQLQQIRSYYKFNDADIDRYTIKREPTPDAPNPTETVQVMVSARELDYSNVRAEAKTWFNEHLIYTHGYGFTMSPVNTADAGGFPEYFVKDIGTEIGSGTTLGISDARIRASIPIGYPRIYYGELTDTYVLAPSRVQELDYPSGDENAYNNYNGDGGVFVNRWWRRLLFARHLGDWQLLFNRDLTPATKLLFRRNIKERVQAVAPFLRFDSDPYLVVADTTLLSDRTPQVQPPNYLYWVIDAYTTGDRYPYSDPGERSFNYIRNAVKVVVDAYNGSLHFYIADSHDPLIETWQRIFPKLFEPIANMPTTLRTHIRYPQDLFRIQCERLLEYHMKDPQVFYNREDLWRFPTEIYGGEAQSVEPYYLIMRLPTAESTEFILLNPFTPVARNNLIAWLAGRSDSYNYGKLLLYQFPKQELVYGTEQIEARINQDPVISEQITLWNRQGSRVIQGNLLVIPIERSLLYVEPIYLEAEQTSLPTLVRVIVVYEDRIAMAKTLEDALETIFQQQTITPSPTILRPLEDADVPNIPDTLTPEEETETDEES